MRRKTSPHTLANGNPRKLSRHPLTARQSRFVQEFLVDGNATQAAIRAGYSARTADTQASQLLRKTQVADALELQQAKLRKKMDVSAMRVVQELVSLGLSNIRNLVDQDPVTKEMRMKDLATVPAHVLASIATIEQNEEGTGRNRRRKTKVTLWPKLPALDSLIKMLGYSSQTIETELAQQQPENWQANLLDPRTFTDEEFEVFKKINARRLAQLGK